MGTDPKGGPALGVKLSFPARQRVDDLANESSVLVPTQTTGDAPKGVAWFQPGTSTVESHGKVNWAVVFGFKAPASPDEALFGTHIREALNVIRNW